MREAAQGSTSRIGVAFEIPSALLREVAPLADLDFALAHRVLEDWPYAKFFASRDLGRELILDNSFHELGKPLTVLELHEAARRSHADYVIAPDVLGEPAKNLQWFRETQEGLGSEFKIAVVASGNTPDDRARFLDATADAQMLCMPYREQRLAWFLENPARCSRVHLLGVSTLEEAHAWTTVAGQFPHIRFSIDTSKPIKAAILGRALCDGGSLRGLPISSKDLLGLTSFTPAQLVLMSQNVQEFRRRLQCP
jgi:hypothetical protein